MTGKMVTSQDKELPIVNYDSQFGLHIVADKTANNIFYYELLDYDMSSFVGDYRRFV